MMTKSKICILGSSDSYTRMVAKSLKDFGLDFCLILVKPDKPKNYIEKLLSFPVKLYNYLNSGRYKSLSKLSLFTWSIFFRSLIFKRSKLARDINDRFKDFDQDFEIIEVPSINHVKTLRILERLSFDLGVLAGVEIVDAEIINTFNSFCLNAHPAPLPQCRGSGALINTLAMKLKPSVSVHIVTAEIDGGDILLVQELGLHKFDSYESINMRLGVLCAEKLAEVVNTIVSGGSYVRTSNDNPKLNYWKDCKLDLQQLAEHNLKFLLSSL